jgi:MFS family permease
MTAPVKRADVLGRDSWIRLFALCAAILFEGMSLSSINVQSARMGEDMGLTPDQLQLAVGAFLTAYAGLLPSGGAAADRWGRRRVFVTGLAVFAVGSFAAALSQDVAQLVIARLLQGAGSAVTAPAAVALITAEFPEGPLRTRAMGVFSTAGAAGFSLGVVLGGLIASSLGWRWAFVMYVPAALCVIVVAMRMLNRDPGRPDRAVPWGQALLLTLGMTGLIHAIGTIPSPDAADYAVGGGGLALLAAFAAVQRRSAVHLLPGRLLAGGGLGTAGIALGGAFAGITGAMFLVSIQLQESAGYTPFTLGLALLPQSLVVAVLSGVVARLTDRHPPRRILLVGMVLVCVGLALYVRSTDGPYVLHLMPATLFVGAGIATVFPAAILIVTAGAAPGDQGLAAALLTTCQQAGGAIGIAVVTAAQSAWTSVGAGLWAAVVLTVVCSALSAQGARGMARTA